MAHPFGLSMPQSLITTNAPDGRSVFTQDEASSHPNFKTSGFADLHVASSIPVDLTQDLAETASFSAANKSMIAVQATGVCFRRTEQPPGGSTPMHRTLTMDYGTVIEGEAELLLDSGERRVLKAGDTIVQRATMHQWFNRSTTQWVRIVWVVFPIQPLEVNGQLLKGEGLEDGV
ncbi:hypothetical protein BT63DRAFT_460893 [Microthyrium microscopicum]|uniref:Cupin type-2 domain-containing protein n=1 Tax=Microthyrium microscopicum TaxID=703497 RepID=A0A6A6TUL7_9PEZI|nr:hypothetical protein BT63DRAFT_460893 [Microthyrium microscopicum]